MRLLVLKSVTFFRPLSVLMADLAAGKKAAAVKAIDDYVKVASMSDLYYINC